MGRPRSFDVDDVVARAHRTFARSGYDGTSVDDLLRETGLGRASLYATFASKRGLFLAALDEVRRRSSPSPEDLDLVLVALMDLGPIDDDVRTRTNRLIEQHDIDAGLLGRRILERALLRAPAPEGREIP